jgi:phage FluMu protein Com
MTSPSEEIEVQCPKCSTIYKDTIRASINLSLGEEWTDEEIDEATSVTCPNCKYKQYGDAIIASNE